MKHKRKVAGKKAIAIKLNSHNSVSIYFCLIIITFTLI